MLDTAFLFLVGGTIVAMLAHFYVLNFLMLMVFNHHAPSFVPLLRGVFLGTAAGVFIAAAWPMAQPPVAMIISTYFILTGLKGLAAHQRPVVVLVNVLFAFAPLGIRASSGL